VDAGKARASKSSFPTFVTKAAFRGAEGYNKGTKEAGENHKRNRWFWVLKCFLHQGGCRGRGPWGVRGTGGARELMGSPC